MIARISWVLLLAALFPAPVVVFAQSDSAKTQAVFMAGQLEQRCAAGFKRYERFKSSNRLLEPGASGRLVWAEITKSLGHELSTAITGYLKAIRSGWKQSDADLAKALVKIKAMADRMEKVGVWTCFRWDDAEFPAASRERLDAIRLKAWEGTLLVKAGKLDAASGAFQFAKKLVSEYGSDIERALDEGKQVNDTRKHPAYLRTLEEMDRLHASVAGQLGKVTEGRARLKRDIAALAAAAKTHAPFLREIQNARAPSGTEDKIIEAIDRLRKRLDEFDAGPGKAARRALAEFGDRYGTDRDAITASVTRIMGNEKLKYGTQSPQSLYTSLDSGLKRIPVLRGELTAQLLSIAARNAGTKATDPARQKEAFDRARRCIGIALEIDPGNAQATKLREGLGAGAAAAAKATESLLDQGTWEDHSERFQGPGDADDLAQAARDWLAGDAGWTKGKDVLAVRVNGDWLVAEKNIKGEPVSWGLPVEAAFVRHTDKDAGRDAAIVFRLTMVTRDAEKSPPFKLARVGSTRQMRASKISTEESGAGPNVVFKLLLVVALLASGLLLVGPALSARVPALGSLLGLLTPLRAIIGVSTLGIGVVLLVLNLLSPFSDVLPQVAAIAAGLFLGLELLLRKRSGAESGEGHKVDAAVDKAQEFIGRQKERIGKIGKYQLPLGIACLVLALLHLFGAGAPLI